MKNINLLNLVILLVFPFLCTSCNRVMNYSMYYMVGGEDRLREYVSREFDAFLNQHVPDETVREEVKSIILKRELETAKAQMKYSSMSDSYVITDDQKNKLREINKKSYFKTLDALKILLPESTYESIVPLIKKSNYYGKGKPPHEFDLM